MRAPGPLLAGLLLTAALAGCIDPFFGSDDRQTGDLVRSIRFTFDERTLAGLDGVDDPDAFFRAASETIFRYTHSGADKATASVTVAFTDDRGREVERPLSDFTSSPLVSPGDAIEITGAAPYSDMKISDALGTIAERRHVVADWYEVDGMPLPIAAGRGSSAAWQFTGDAGVDVGFSHAGFEDRSSRRSYACHEYGCNETIEEYYAATEIDDLTFSLGAQGDGTFAVGAIAAGQDTNLDFQIAGEISMTAALEGVLSVFKDQPGNYSADESGPFGFEMSGSANGEGLGRLVFSPNGLLRATGGSGSIETSATGKMWEPGQAKEDAGDWFDGDDLPSDASPYRETPYESYDSAPGMLTDFVRQIYGMTLIPGDEFVAVVEYQDFVVAVEGSFHVVVAARENKQVAAGNIDSLRIETSFNFRVTPEGGSPNNIGFQGLTHWIHAETYLPVLMQQQTPADWPSDEQIQEILDAIADLSEAQGGLDGMTLPTGITSAINAEATLEMTSIVGKVRVPAIMSLMGLWGAYALPMSAMAFGTGYGYAYGYDHDYPAYYGEPIRCIDCEYDEYPPDESPPHPPAPSHVPTIWFNRSDDATHVARASSDADWSDIRVKLNGDCWAYLRYANGSHDLEPGAPASWQPRPVQAGDYIGLQGTGSCSMNVVHVPSNALVYSARFEL